MNYQIKLIENIESFNAIYLQLSDASLIYKNPNIHFVGFYCEYISESNYPDRFKESLNWVKCNDRYKNAVCKIQIACDNLCIIIDLIKFNNNLPQNLINILTSDSWIKCGVSVSTDITYISYNFQLGQCSGVYEMKTLATLANCKNPNLENIYSKMYSTNYEKTKRHTISDWSSDMTIEMAKYAS
jgi:hypothetical protein